MGLVEFGKLCRRGLAKLSELCRRERVNSRKFQAMGRIDLRQLQFMFRHQIILRFRPLPEIGRFKLQRLGLGYSNSIDISCRMYERAR